MNQPIDLTSLPSVTHSRHRMGKLKSGLYFALGAVATLFWCVFCFCAGYGLFHLFEWFNRAHA